MAVSCTPADLAEAAKCYCYEPGEREKVKTYLLAVIAGLDHLTPKQLADAAACYCYDQTQGRAVNTYLLCQAANGGDGSCEALEGANSPEGAVTPDFIGQLYHETGDDTYWRSTGLTNADWVEITVEQFMETVPAGNAGAFHVGAYGDVPGVTELTWRGVDNLWGIDLESNSLVTFNAPLLETIGPGAYVFFDSTGLVTISMPLLQSIDVSFQLSCANLVTIDLGSVTDISVEVDFSNCTNLLNVDLSSLQTTSGGALVFNGTSIVTLNLSSLTSAGQDLAFVNCVDLASLDLSALTTVRMFSVNGCTSLASLSMPVLVSATQGIDCAGCTSLASVTLSSYLPTNAQAQNFSACALTAASVNHILARAVANAGYVSGTITLSGGTNAAPTGQGIVDKATLIGRGCTVNTN